MFRVIIAGGRKFNNYSLLKEKCDNILSNVNDRIAIVCGCAYGADLLGEKYAKEKDYIVHYYPANWKLYGKGAGMIRNKEMAENAEALIVFWDGESKGTKNMIEIAKNKNLKVRIINYATS